MSGQIDQCLFGYQEGHRLLATSVPLHEHSTELTYLSDLAPNTIFGETSGYWTGYPLGNLRRYALIRTWNAPEKSRPGCVWSHALLIPPEYFEMNSNLSVFKSLVRRPSDELDIDAYTVPIEFSEGHNQLLYGIENDNEQLIVRLLQSIYENNDTNIFVEPKDNLENIVFAIWSQQWPRLRRNFKFQTVVSSLVKSNSKFVFDFKFILRGPRNLVDSNIRTSKWVEIAQRDIIEGGGKLRSYLWKYGSDVRKLKNSFKPLCNLKLFENSVDKDSAERIISVLKKDFPNSNDAISLKKDILDGEIFSKIQIEILLHLLSPENNDMVLTPNSENFGKALAIHPNRTNEFLEIAELLVDKKYSRKSIILNEFIDSIRIEAIIGKIKDFPNLIIYLIKSNPNVLLTNEFRMVNSKGLIMLIEYFQSGSKFIKTQLIKLSLDKNNFEYIDKLFEIEPVELAIQVIQMANQDSSFIKSDWFNELSMRPKLYYKDEIFSKIINASVVFELMKLQNWSTKVVSEFGIEKWQTLVEKIMWDIDEKKSDHLKVFLVSISLFSSKNEPKVIFEKYFEEIFDKLSNFELTWETKKILKNSIPKNFFGDTREEFIIALLKTYKKKDRTSKNIKKLAKSKETQKLLLKICNRLK